MPYVMYAEDGMPFSHPSLDELVEELAEYLWQPKEQVKEKVARGAELMAAEWREKNPKGEEEIQKFYKETENYWYDLTWWQGQITDFRHRVILKAYEHGGKVLDYGAGMGDACLLLAGANVDITYADLGGKLMDYARWRAVKRGAEIEFIELDKERITKNYDVIICLEVLEHLTDPVAALKLFHERLEEDGILILKESLPEKEEETHPMHIPNLPLKKDFENVMAEIGFERLDDITWKKKC